MFLRIPLTVQNSNWESKNFSWFVCLFSYFSFDFLWFLLCFCLQLIACKEINGQWSMPLPLGEFYWCYWCATDASDANNNDNHAQRIVEWASKPFSSAIHLNRERLQNDVLTATESLSDRRDLHRTHRHHTKCPKIQFNAIDNQTNGSRAINCYNIKIKIFYIFQHTHAHTHITHIHVNNYLFISINITL